MVQYPGAAEIRFVRLIRLRCGESLGQAENTEAREGSERAQQEVLHQEWEVLLILYAREGKCGFIQGGVF